MQPRSTQPIDPKIEPAKSDNVAGDSDALFEFIRLTLEHQQAERDKNLTPFVKDVIKAAGQHFKPGYEVAKEHKSDQRFPRRVDPRFTYNANLIAGTNLIAAAGPHSYRDVDTLLLNTVFHPSLPTKKIIALGNGLHNSNSRWSETFDFIDYFLSTPDQTGKRYSFSINKDKLNIPFQQIDILYGSKKGVTVPKSIGQSYLTVHPKNKKDEEHELEVTCIPLADNDSIDLNDDPDDLKKELLWKISKESENERFLVHCASGIGRTGHLILTLEILKHAKEIFETGDANAAAAKILEIVNRMRQDRYCLIQVPEQLDGAIRNAYILYQYGLQKNYINQNTPAGTDEVKSSPKPIKISQYTGDYTELTVAEAKRKALNKQKYSDFIDKIHLSPNSNIHAFIDEYDHLKIATADQPGYKNLPRLLLTKAKYFDLDDASSYCSGEGDGHPSNRFGVPNDQDPESVDKFLSSVELQLNALFAREKNKPEIMALNKRKFSEFIDKLKLHTPKLHIFTDNSSGALVFAVVNEPKYIQLKQNIDQVASKYYLGFKHHKSRGADGHPKIRLIIPADQDPEMLNLFLLSVSLKLELATGHISKEKYETEKAKLEINDKQADSQQVSSTADPKEFKKTEISVKNPLMYFSGSKESQAKTKVALQREIDDEKPSVLKPTFG